MQRVHPNLVARRWFLRECGVGLGAVAVILGVFVLGPVLATPVMRVLGSPASHLSGATGRLAVENVKRNPKRTAATASALMIGVALVGFITILAASTKASVEKAVDDSFRADFVIDSGSWGQGGFETGLADQVAARPEVDVVSPFRTTWGMISPKPSVTIAR